MSLQAVSTLLGIPHEDNGMKIQEISSYSTLSSSTSTVRHLLRTPTPSLSQYGEIVPRISGCISTLSSVLLIYIVCVSPTKFSTVAYRLLFCISFFDIVGSMAMSMTHLPMPTEDVLYLVDNYRFQGLRLGNVSTCSAQGFCYLFGLIATCGYNSMLCVYYSCIIAFNIPGDIMHKCIEPVLYLLPIGMALWAAVPPLFQDMYNPTPWEPWCSVDSVPFGGCYSGCQRGNANYRDVDPTFMVFFQFALIIISLGLVFEKVSRVHRQMHLLQVRAQRNSSNVRRQREGFGQQNYNSSVVGESNEVNAQEQQLRDEERQHQYSREALREDRVRMLQDRHRLTRVVLIQCVAYITAQILTLIWIVLKTSFTLDFAHLRLLFQPLQGFWNFIIFIVFKVYHVRKTNQSMTLGEALGIIFFPARTVHHNGFGANVTRTDVNDESNLGHISILRTQQDDLQGFQIGDDFISISEFIELHDMDDLSVDIEDDDVSNRETAESLNWSDDNQQGQRYRRTSDRGVKDELDDAFSMDQEE